MRLIDADVLIKRIEESWHCDKCEASCVDDYGYTPCLAHQIKEQVWAQPTAYDIDKVVEEIDRYSIDNTDYSYSTNPELASYYLIRTKDAVDIIKGVK